MNGKAKWIVTSWLVVALMPLLAVAAVNNAAPPADNRQAPLTDRTPLTGQAADFNPTLEKANELIGAKVVNNTGEKLGTVEDIVLTPDRTGVSYVVLSHGGLWGWGGKLFAVPWSEFEIRARDNVLVLSNVKPDDLKNAKGFDKDHWPATADKNWLGMDTTRGATPGGSEPTAMETDRNAAPMNERVEARTDRPDTPGVAEPATAKTEIKYRRLSELVGLTIKNDQGEELGELEDIVIDTHEGKVAYAVLSMRSGFLGLNKDLAAVPWSSFEILPQLGTARLNADKETLKSIAFDADKFPDLANREYSTRIHERFGATPYWETYGYVPGAGATRPEATPRMEGDRYDSEHRAHEGMTHPEGMAPRESGRYEPQFNPSEVKTIHGTIMSVGTFRPEGTSVEGLRLRVKTDDGKTVTVHVGPRQYVERQNIDLHYGDEVTITGAPAKAGWRDVFVASQIKAGDKTLDLRTPEGKPRWNPEDFEGSRSGDYRTAPGM